ncbi:MAG: hypothetical protein LUE29_03890 [Lachnospiraceae bacterium]|nr:hypothetical protein [Lachnospiraceae bacterium]
MKKRQMLLFSSCLVLIIAALLGMAGCGGGASGTEDETSTVSEAGKDSDGTDTMQIYDLRVQGLEAPIGLGTEQPSLSWKLESDVQNQTQTAYRIVASSTEESLC